MKSMHIAASRELVSRLSTHRRVVALDSTDSVSYTHLTLPTIA